MKGILEFDLPTDENDFLICSRALDWALVVWDLNEQLRSYLKHGHSFGSADEALEVIRESLFDFLEQHDVSLDMIH